MHHLKFSPKHIQNHKPFMIGAIQRNGEALEYASPLLQNDKEVVSVAVLQDGRLLRFASPNLKRDVDIALIAVKQCWAALKFVSPELWTIKELKDVVTNYMEQDGMRLEETTLELQMDKDVVIGAVSQNGLAIVFASSELLNDKKVILAAVRQNPTAFKHCDLSFELRRKDKEVALDFVKMNPDNIKYLHEELKQDYHVLVAAGMFDEDYSDQNLVMEDFSSSSSISNEQNDDNSERTETETKIDDASTPTIKMKIVLSTRISLNQDSHSSATWFTNLFKKDPYIQTRFKVFAPNAFKKETCDKNWTDYEHPCRGTSSCCTYNNVLSDKGRPTNNCCWRYSFRFQLEEAKATGGFMLQLVERGDEDYQEFGKGQKIERDMANQMKLKIFRVYRPVNRYGREYDINSRHIEEVIDAILGWYIDGCQDMSESIVKFSTQGGIGSEKPEIAENREFLSIDAAW